MSNFCTLLTTYWVWGKWEFFRLFEKKVIVEKEAYLLTDNWIIDRHWRDELRCWLRGTDYFKHVYLTKETWIFFQWKNWIWKSEQEITCSSTWYQSLFLCKKKKTLEGSGLRDSDLTKAFARMVNRKLVSQSKTMKWPISAEELIKHWLLSLRFYIRSMVS